MNLLAHLLLSGPDPEVRLGNVLGDLVKGQVEGEAGEKRGDLPPRVLAGARLHRRIDAFTDSHEIPRRSQALIWPEWARYASVLVDIYYDHALSRNWREFCAVPLREFLDGAYRQFGEMDLDALPPYFPLVARRMIQGDWLASYGSQAGIELTLRRVSRRLRRPVELERAAAQLPEIYPALEADFLEFWPQLKEAVAPALE
jgi:acyl carrier protein phosphodiesterase